MRSRGFSLIEVLVALAIFALAAVGLGAAYTNVLLGRQALKLYDVGAEDLARCRAALLETVNLADLETGGAVNLPDGRVANWKAQAEPTEVSDLFRVTLRIELPEEGATPGQVREETRLLLRPTWSTASDRKIIRDAAKTRLLKERGYEEATGGGGMVSAPTARPALGGNNQNGGGADNGKRDARPGGNNTKGNPPNQSGNTNGRPNNGANPTPTKNQPSGGKNGGPAPSGGKTAPRPIL